jgi:hypothetical protein
VGISPPHSHFVIVGLGNFSFEGEISPPLFSLLTLSIQQCTTCHGFVCSGVQEGQTDPEISKICHVAILVGTRVPTSVQVCYLTGFQTSEASFQQRSLAWRTRISYEICRQRHNSATRDAERVAVHDSIGDELSRIVVDCGDYPGLCGY